MTRSTGSYTPMYTARRWHEALLAAEQFSTLTGVRYRVVGVPNTWVGGYRWLAHPILPEAPC